MNKVVCVAGMAGSGKSVVSDYFVNHQFHFIRFGQVVLDELIQRNVKPGEKEQKKIREEFRKKYGMAAMAYLNYPKIKTLLKKQNVVVDGLYSWSEYKYLKSKLATQVIVLAVFSPPNIRYQRLSKRKPDKNDKQLRNHHFNEKEAKKRDFSEIENIEKGGPIAMADFTVLNTKDQTFLSKQLNDIYNQIIKI